MLQQLRQQQTIPFSQQHQLSLLNRTDMAAICTMLNDERVNQYLYFAPAPESTYHSYFGPQFDAMEQNLAAGELPQPLMVAIRTEQGEFAGMAALMATEGKPGTYDVGYQLPANSWGHGLATAACRLLVDFAFKHYQAERVQADAYDSNNGSKRVLEKSGLGRTHKIYGHFEGGIDQSWFAIDKAQWLRSRQIAG
ncbi:GNAT family N-acetyltransferase [Ferrimonas lipolytica]|uniref:GNAT family N-acetyltransferase n=1 Tax=Ferrimonas lipolytica TaxID=2724191 RepID=A0A6H1UH94_9GAMM|nr:GNAT family N-acetyltransferase [Ferrimonas lipolytica]QIZ77999.1 GNAT family N-acetyltransferase [Ferrimonas lipolytica]